MCEYCHMYPHHSRCPATPKSRVRGRCKVCNEELEEDYEYYTDDDNNEFCSKECAMEYYEIRPTGWDLEEME